MSKCKDCGDYYRDREVCDTGMCDRCEDRAIARMYKSLEWHKCHPDHRMPDSEMKDS